MQTQVAGVTAIDSETKSILVKDIVIILAALGGVLAFYGLLKLVSVIAHIPLP